MFFENIGLKVPEILLPNKAVDLTTWTVIACDQYVHSQEYWNEVDALVGDTPSTLRMIFPEAFLGDRSVEEATIAINATMKRYLSDGTLVKSEPGFIAVKRTLADGSNRCGLVVALDLEKYDYRNHSETLIRTTEGTFLDKVTPRVKIRQQALLESPHILVLIDDPKRTVIEPLFDMNLDVAYDFDLMKGAGHLKGLKVTKESAIKQVAQALEGLMNPELIKAKYGESITKPILYAMGDGNHSFATAYQVWNKVKTEIKDPELLLTHPARFALVELMNIHDDGLTVEPIHRVMYHIQPESFLKEMKEFYQNKGATAEIIATSSLEDAEAKANKERKPGIHALAYNQEGKYGVIKVTGAKYGIEMEMLEDFLDHYEKKCQDSKLGFIHGEAVVTDIASKVGNIGFYLPNIIKSEVFKTVLEHGIYPRKTFSLGHADDKRFYLECRSITL